MKKLTIAVLIVVMLWGQSITAYAFGDVGLDNFEKSNTYLETQFTDVSKTSRFYENVKAVYEYGLMNGKTNDKFDPTGNITIAQSIVVAMRIHWIYTMGSIPALDEYDTGEWYLPYVRSALETYKYFKNTRNH